MSQTLLPAPALTRRASGTSVHSATLGKGKSDNTLVRVKQGDLAGKGEVTLVFGKQVGNVAATSPTSLPWR